MRPLSRFLSVFLALILTATAFVTASAHDPATSGNTVTKSAVTVFVDLDTDIEDGIVHPGDVLKFTISVYRDDTAHDITDITVLGPDPDTAVVTDDVVADDLADLTNSKIVDSHQVSYTVGLLPTNVTRQTISLVWTATFTAVDAGTAATPANSHTAVTDAASAKYDITVVKRGDFAADIIGLTLDFSATTGPDGTPKRGDEVAFKLMATMGDTYGLVDADDALASPTDTDVGHSIQFPIMKTLVDEDGKDVSTRTVGVVSLPVLGRNSESSELKSNPDKYKLRAEDIKQIEDGGSIRFHYKFAVGENNIRKADGNAPDLNKDGDMTDKIADVSGTILTIPEPVVEEEEAPDPNLVGSNSAATVTLSEDGSSIEVTPTDGVSFSLLIGRLYTDGSAQFVNGGYIRQDRDPQGRGYGQTYGIVKRDSDGKVVRKWISSADPIVMSGGIDWSVVEMHYTYPRDVISAIPLDEMYPVNNQLVRNDADGKIYVYRTGAWRHIPDTATFKYHGFFWCDVTSADADFFNRFTEGGALAPSGTADDPNYPSCHNM